MATQIPVQRGSTIFSFIRWLFGVLTSWRVLLPLITGIILLSFFINALPQTFPENCFLKDGIFCKVNPIPLFDSTIGGLLTGDTKIYEAIEFLKNTSEISNLDYFKTIIKILAGLWMIGILFRVVRWFHKLTIRRESDPQLNDYVVFVLVMIFISTFYNAIVLLFGGIQLTPESFYLLLPFKGIVALFVNYNLWLTPFVDKITSLFDWMPYAK